MKQQNINVKTLQFKTICKDDCSRIRTVTESTTDRPTHRRHAPATPYTSASVGGTFNDTTASQH